MHRPGSGTELPGAAAACDALRSGGAVVLPNPWPMSYGVVATRALRVNAVKGRRPDQNVAVSLHDPSEWRHLVPSLDLPTAALDGVLALLERRFTVLLPVRTGVPYPDWVSPAVDAGDLAVFDGRWAPTATVWREFPRLYGSSANRTGEEPATTAAQARAALGEDCLVVDGDALEGARGPRAASTIVRLDRGARLSLYRPGAQDQAAAPATGYLRRVARLTGLRMADATGEPG